MLAHSNVVGQTLHEALQRICETTLKGTIKITYTNVYLCTLLLFILLRVGVLEKNNYVALLRIDERPRTKNLPLTDKQHKKDIVSNVATRVGTSDIRYTSRCYSAHLIIFATRVRPVGISSHPPGHFSTRLSLTSQELCSVGTDATERGTCYVSDCYWRFKDVSINALEFCIVYLLPMHKWSDAVWLNWRANRWSVVKGHAIVSVHWIKD